MAEIENKQVRPAFECEKRNLVNAIPENRRVKPEQRSAIICRGYNRALKHRVAQVAS